MTKRSLISFSLLAALLTAPAYAGPPLICHPVSIGDARSLPWDPNAGWNGMLASYDTAHLVDDTLALVVPQSPVEVRMETLRRAAIYTSRDPSLGDAIAKRLFARNAWFEAGFFIEAVRQAAQAYAMIHDPAARAAWHLHSPPPFVASALQGDAVTHAR